jgi:hypothetical protein
MREWEKREAKRETYSLPVTSCLRNEELATTETAAF